MQIYRVATMTDDFEILVINGLTGECLTTADLPDIPDVDDWTQRLKENPPEPELTPEQMDAIRQENESFLTQLEALAVQAIAIGYWDEVYDFISFHAPATEDS